MKEIKDLFNIGSNSGITYMFGLRFIELQSMSSSIDRISSILSIQLASSKYRVLLQKTNLGKRPQADQ